MAKVRQNPWIPSGGVLIVAIIAAVVAAVLLNVYISLIEAPYRDKVEFFILKNDVPKGKTIERADLDKVAIPKPLTEGVLFERYAKAVYDSAVFGKPARYDLLKGNLLHNRDVLEGAEYAMVKDLQEGYEMVTVEIEPEPSLQPGMFVTLRGYFDLNPDKKIEDIQPFDVLYDVQVRAIGGYAEAVDDRKRSMDNIQVFLPREHGKRLMELEKMMFSTRFKVAIQATPKGPRNEPTLAPEAVDLLQKRTAAGPVLP